MRQPKCNGLVPLASAQFFAPEALWILAGGGTTLSLPKLFQFESDANTINQIV
jgi:hypothetical protein